MISLVHRCQGTTACHNVVNCLQSCTAQAASGTDISMQNVALIITNLKSLVLSSNNQSLSCSRNIRRLQPSVGLFHVHRWFLSETAILTVHRFSAAGVHTKITAARTGMFCFCVRCLLEDTIRQHGATSMQALRLVVLREIFLQLCGKLMGHALDSMRGLPSITLMYHLHKEIRAVTKVTVCPHNTRSICRLDLL